MKKPNYEENKSIYKTREVTRRVSSLLSDMQFSLGLTQLQMSQKLDMPLQTYKRISSPKNRSNISMESLGKIFENSDITFQDVFSGIYR